MLYKLDRLEPKAEANVFFLLCPIFTQPPSSMKHQTQNSRQSSLLHTTTDHAYLLSVGFLIISLHSVFTITILIKCAAKLS